MPQISHAPRIGVFSLIGWSFLDQRPQVFARSLAEWGFETIYFEPYDEFFVWGDSENHPIQEYIARCYLLTPISPRLSRYRLLSIPPWTWFEKSQTLNLEFDRLNREKIAAQKLDYAIINDPRWAPLLVELGIPYIYDHLDDTHHMGHVLTEKFFSMCQWAEKHSTLNLYIQPQTAKRNRGLFVPNGVSIEDLKFNPQSPKLFDAACISCIADWFDIESILKTKKKILLIGPIEDAEIFRAYQAYRSQGGNHVTWLGKLPRALAAQWLSRARVGLVPFRQDHAVIDYVMPLKIVEYYALGMASVCYVNKGVLDCFGDHVYSYSPSGWLNFPNLDQAIEQAARDIRVDERLHLAQNFQWGTLLAPLKNFLFEQERLQR